MRGPGPLDPPRPRAQKNPPGKSAKAGFFVIGSPRRSNYQSARRVEQGSGFVPPTRPAALILSKAFANASDSEADALASLGCPFASATEVCGCGLEIEAAC